MLKKKNHFIPKIHKIIKRSLNKIRLRFIRFYPQIRYDIPITAMPNIKQISAAVP